MNRPLESHAVMPFVKLDTKILDSTLWLERECREIFITALLMAEPREITEPTEALKVHAIEPLGFKIPLGWYGFVPAAGSGISYRAGIPIEIGLQALEKLSLPDLGSRSPEHEGRRMVRIDGGYLILNYMKYRDRDYTAAERQRRLRERKKLTRDSNGITRDSNVTSRIAEADIEAYIKPKIKSIVHFRAPTREEVSAYCSERNNHVDPNHWFDYYEANGWKVGRNSMKDWKACIRYWEKSGGLNGGNGNGNGSRQVSASEARSIRSKQNILDGFAKNAGRANPPDVA